MKYRPDIDIENCRKDWIQYQKQGTDTSDNGELSKTYKDLPASLKEWLYITRGQKGVKQFRTTLGKYYENIFPIDPRLIEHIPHRQYNPNKIYHIIDRVPISLEDLFYYDDKISNSWVWKYWFLYDDKIIPPMVVSICTMCVGGVIYLFKILW